MLVRAPMPPSGGGAPATSCSVSPRPLAAVRRGAPLSSPSLHPRHCDTRRSSFHAPATPPGQEPASPRPSTADAPLFSGGPIAVGAVALGAVAFIAARLVSASSGGSLADVAAGSVPLAAALASGRPTVVEFYADYCEVRGRDENEE